MAFRSDLCRYQISTNRKIFLRTHHIPLQHFAVRHVNIHSVGCKDILLLYSSSAFLLFFFMWGRNLSNSIFSFIILINIHTKRSNKMRVEYRVHILFCRRVDGNVCSMKIATTFRGNFFYPVFCLQVKFNLVKLSGYYGFSLR